jgi:hypothetical protein
MSNKSIVILIVTVVVILAGAIFYNYSQTPDEINQNNNININRPGIPVIKGPAIEVIPDSYDLGTVIYGEVAKHTFAVKNSGDESLEILRLSTSCGCTKATVAETNKVIAPGQSVEMMVTFDPAVHEDDHDLGDVTRIVYIKTNDSKNPEVEVEITANVIKN